ncbi:MAG: hypothetical protein RLZZ337_84 [Bacteroidota bacterium]|jgi:hypothetical protein
MKNLKKIRVLTALFIVGLAVSGLTCFPLLAEIEAGKRFYFAYGYAEPAFVLQVFEGITNTCAHYPFLFYGTDWLGFAHLLFAILFYGVYKDPAKHIWITQFGIFACIAIFPFAFIMGSIRGIPFWWQLVDCSFGVLGLACLLPVYILTNRLINN